MTPQTLPCVSFSCVFRYVGVSWFVHPSPVDGICVVSSFHFLTPTVKLLWAYVASLLVEVLLFLSKDSGEGWVPQEALACVPSVAVPLAAPLTWTRGPVALPAQRVFGRSSYLSYWCVSLYLIVEKSYISLMIYVYIKSYVWYIGCECFFPVCGLACLFIFKAVSFND